ncbi:MAG: sulfatase-like hydrolase/transferase [Elusimicrobiota bacterium]
MKKIMPEYFKFLFSVFISGMLLFSIFRITLFLMNLHLADGLPQEQILFALFNRGILFDLNMNAFILVLPGLAFTIEYFAKKRSAVLQKIINFYIVTAYTIAIVISTMDLPFFLYYNSRITRTVFYWFDNVYLMFKAVFTTPQYYPVIFTVFILSFIFAKIIAYFKTLYLEKNYTIKHRFPKRLSIFFVTAFLFFLGIRGDADPNSMPISVKDSFFCDYAFLNQLGVHPMYNFMDSFLHYRVNYFKDDDIAVDHARRYLGITETSYDSPIARNVSFTEDAIKPNIVIVIIESMSANKMKKFGCGKDLTPNLEKLADEGRLFTNFYTSSIHTADGIFAALYSFPVIMREKPMSSIQSASRTFYGMPQVLQENGYQNIFIYTGDMEFDNMGAFLSGNGFNEIISKPHYSKDSLQNSWGVYDHVMFDYAVPKLTEMSKSDKPFFAVFMTISSHIWISIPEIEGFDRRFEDNDDAIYDYTDWSIGRFIEKSKQEPWFDNTIFVFFGDHGQNFDAIYDMPIAYHHSPLIIYAPKLVKPEVYDNLALQIDVFPTVMGIIRIPYINNTLGVDISKEERPYAYFSADNKIGCLNDDMYLVMRSNNQTSMYDYKGKSTQDRIESNKELFTSMNDYTFSMLQTAQWMIDHQKVKDPR